MGSVKKLEKASIFKIEAFFVHLKGLNLRASGTEV